LQLQSIIIIIIIILSSSSSSLMNWQRKHWLCDSWII